MDVYIHIPEETAALRKRDTTAENRPNLAENAEKRPNIAEKAKNAENRPSISNVRMQEETASLRGGGGAGGGGGGGRGGGGKENIKDKEAEKRSAEKRSDIAGNAGKRPIPTENVEKRPNLAESGGGGGRKTCSFGSRRFPWILPESCRASGGFLFVCIYSGLYTCMGVCE